MNENYIFIDTRSNLTLFLFWNDSLNIKMEPIKKTLRGFITEDPL